MSMGPLGLGLSLWARQYGSAAPPLPVPTLAPLTTSSTLAGIPAETAQNYDPNDPILYPDEAYRQVAGWFADWPEYMTMEASRRIAVVTGENVGAVQLTIGGVTVFMQPGTTANPDMSPVTAWCADIDLSSAPNGWVRMEARLIPDKGGIPRIISIPGHLCANAIGANWVPAAIRYIDPNIAVSGNGLTPATAFKTFLDAMTATPTTGGTSSKNARWTYRILPCAKGDLLWVGQTGEIGGVRRIYTYPPTFESYGAAWSGYITVPTAGSPPSWNAASFGNRAEGGMHGIFKNLSINLQGAIQKNRSAAFINCDLMDDYGELRPTYLGYPAAIDGGAFDYGGLMRWLDGTSANDRWTMIDCRIRLGECGTIAVRTNCYGTVSGDCYFVGVLGNWAHYNDRVEQRGQFEINFHSGQFLEIEGTPTTGTFGSQTYTDVVFKAGPSLWNVSGVPGIDGNNTFMRVLQAANPACKTGQRVYPQNPDGTSDFDYLGYQVGASTSTGVGWLGSSGYVSGARTARIFDAPPLADGDQVTIYVISHGDMGQVSNQASSLIAFANRVNFTRVNSLLAGHSWQPFLTGTSSVNAAGTQLDSTNSNITGVTMSAAAGSTEVIISVGGVPGYPSWLKIWDLLGYNAGTGLDHYRVVTKLTDPATGKIQVIEPFITALTNSPVKCSRSWGAYSAINCVQHKGSTRDEVGQLSAKIFDVRNVNCVIPGFTGNGDCLYLRTPGFQNGGTGSHYGIRFKDCIIRRVDCGGGSPPEQWPLGYTGSPVTTLLFENSHIDVASVTPGALPARCLSGTVEIGTSYAYGIGRTAAWDANYRQTGTSLLVQRQTALDIPVGTPIGTSLNRIP